MKKFIKKIWDFVVKPFSKHFWRKLWLEFRARYCYKSVDAKTLMKVCECINPSYARLVEHARRKLGGIAHSLVKVEGGDLLDTSDVADLFYNDRKKFLDKDFLKSVMGAIPDSFYKYLVKKYSPGKEEERFKRMVEKFGLQKHVLCCDDLSSRAIDFVKIVVQGNITLNLVGKFHYCRFHCAKFSGNVDINIYPPFYTPGIGAMIFSKNICCGGFSCSFVGVPHIDIFDNIFMSHTGINIGMPAQLVKREQAHYRIRDLMELFFKDSLAPIAEFSGNQFKRKVFLYPISHFKNNTGVGNPTLGRVRFVNGNHIRKLLMSFPLFPESRPAGLSEVNIGAFSKNKIVRVHDIHFDPHERIDMPWRRETKQEYKEYFVALKNQAIERRDREAEFNHGRKERYFDRGLANRWQDKFILDWSQLVSDSGISWARPIGWLILVQTGLAAAFICSGWCDWDWWVWGKLAVESLDPLSQVESGCARPIYTAIYGVARKIFLFLFLYEIIKVFRRFSK